MAKPKRNGKIDIKIIRRILIVACGILLLAAAAFTVSRHFSTQKENQALEEKRKQSQYSADYYEMNIVGEISPDEVNFANYIPVKQFGDFFINDNAKMLEQTVELTYNSNVDNKYFIKNNCYSCKTDDEAHYYFFGNDEKSLPFYLKISKNWDISEWYVLENFRLPDVRFDIADSIIIIKNDTARGLPSRSLSSKNLCRINDNDALASVSDNAVIDRYLARYNEEVYVFTDVTFDEIKTALESSESGYVLVSFKNFNLYQCIGTY